MPRLSADVRCRFRPFLAWRAIAAARSIRASVSSRPSSATLSKIPGETVVPAIATRTGWNTLPGLAPRALDDPAQRRLDRLDRERLGLGERLARRLQRLDAAVAARSSSGTPPDRPPARRTRTRPAARSRRASGSSPREISTAAAQPGPAGELLEPPRQLVDRRARAASGRSCGGACARRTRPGSWTRARAGSARRARGRLKCSSSAANPAPSSAM